MKGSAKTFSEAPSQRSLVIQSTSAVVDLISGELLELTTFYPNGARETHRTQDDASVQLELSGFTGKEADEEVGVVYFGERYLIPRIGRWASPDPLAIHAAGGGEALNAYHYVSGNLLQARDPVGLESEDRPTESGGGTSAPVEVNTAPEGIRYGQEFVMIPGEIPYDARRVSKHAYHAPQSTLESLKERGASAYIYNPDAPLSLEEARYVEALPPSLARDFMQTLAIFRGELTRSVESLPGVRGVRGGGNPEGSDSDAVYVVALAAQAASAVGPPAIARAAKAAMKAVKAAIAAAKEKVALTRAGRAASSASNAVRLNHQLAAQEIAGGHAFSKHVIEGREFIEFNIRTRRHYANHIEETMNVPDAMKMLKNGRAAFWNDKTGTVVIRNPRAVDGGTAFRPHRGREYFEGLR